MAALSLPYDQQFALWLHVERLRMVPAVANARGVDAALSSARLSDGWFDAAALLAEEVAKIKAETNARRMEQRAKTRIGWRD